LSTLNLSTIAEFLIVISQNKKNQGENKLVVRKGSV